MRLFRYVTALCVLTVMSIPGYAQTARTDSVTLDDVLALMEDAHTTYEQIDVQYHVTSQHQITGEYSESVYRMRADKPAYLLRTDVLYTGEDAPEPRVSIITDAYTYESSGPFGEPLVMQSMPNPQTTDDMNIIRLFGGGVGTRVQPEIALAGRIGQSALRLGEIQTLEVSTDIAAPADTETEIESTDENASTRIINAIELHAQLQDFPVQTVWIDLETGIIVREIQYNEDGTIAYEAVLEGLDTAPDFSEDVFAIDESLYDPEALREMFPPPPADASQEDSNLP